MGIGAEASDRGAADVAIGASAIASSATIANVILRMRGSPSLMEPEWVDRSPGPVSDVPRPSAGNPEVDGIERRRSGNR